MVSFKEGLSVNCKKILAALVIIVFFFTILPNVSVKEIMDLAEVEPIIVLEEAAPSDLEKEMLDYVNEARREADLRELKMNNRLVSLARLKSKDMIDKDYFDHVSPTYGTPFEMMDNHGVFYKTAGENLAGHYDVMGAHEGLMDSPGHRKNILNSSYTEVGIGIVQGGPYKMMITQIFISR